MQEHHVVVVGGGFGGLQLVHGLEGAPVRITLIDRRNHHLFQPLLYQVATTALATSEIAWPIRHLYRDRKEVTTLLAEVTGVDRAARTVQLNSGQVIGFNTLVLATGARHAYFGHDEWERSAPGLKTLEDATTIRRRLLLAFERAELATSEEERQALLTFVIIGAGPTGVEMAGMIAELAHRALPAEFRNVDTTKTRVLLVEAGPRVLPVFTEDLSTYAKEALEKLGVEVLLGTPVTACTDEGVTVGETYYPCRTVVWAAGVQASPAAKWLGAAADRAGRVIVGPQLHLEDDADIFVIGDTAAVNQENGKPVPGIAPAAKQQGAYVAKVIKARLDGKPSPAPFRYSHQGNLATIGKRAAVIDFGRFKLKGVLAWWIWGLAHIYFLIGTRSRLAVAWSWLWIYLSGQHSARLITQKETLKDEA
ncbi:NAD(P)/FAD-dependent oxidoreductase [Agrobacterium fabrum]|uniref:NADH:ubiquinone reductase (non-electrogenic) n=1 Tax=Agrobacterium fabrum TaxID=1176649 RepID=A0A7Z7BGG0_9HYPH|nr:NAD(P)/FAD-dependent oxidoreductase [Agrobacterium fabrum]WCK75358.1 NAD(P)/FAD-dependent oxidoreductase [Agrobacterium fabrum]WIE26453.1 NAD(P)/FAD-dependent oxidoreductase [Agrobacterium fabrum]WIE42410.1 NAD(P)/FAD-dependent oxidoreductase [Agrobacterium fabrum]CUX11513.1 NADH dehydrogenase [Agrobacterium fabrum str. J-07]SDJ17904.1 NADH dehydrogenase [Agrobacterium fabrum]